MDRYTWKSSRRNSFGDRRTFHVPCYVVKEGTLVLSRSAIAVLLVLLQGLKGRSDATLQASKMLSQKTIIERTGFSKNIITDSVKELKSKHFFQSERNVRKYRQFGVNEYIICGEDGNILPVSEGQTPFYWNKIKYLRVPACIVQEPAERWSLANMSGSEIAVYVSVLYLANEHRQNDFEIKQADLSKLSGVGTRTLKKVLTSLEGKGLIWVLANQPLLVIEICDPYTGEPFQINEDKVVHEQGGRWLHSNWTPAQVEQMIRAVLPRDWLVQKSGDELEIRCILHEPDNTPSLKLNTVKRCFHCLSCGAKGFFTQFVSEAKKLDRTGSLQFQAAVLGQETEVHDSDRNVLARYEYRDANGKLLYVKDRMRVNIPGRKKFRTWRPVQNGRVFNITGVKRVLYKLPELSKADVVILTESEKDCNALNQLYPPLVDAVNIPPGIVVATTSGGANTWEDHFADSLLGKKVILLPHNDDAGYEYVRQVRESLDARKIENHSVSFEGAGCKDVAEFLESHSREELIALLDSDWIEQSQTAMPVEVPELVEA